MAFKSRGFFAPLSLFIRRAIRFPEGPDRRLDDRPSPVLTTILGSDLIIKSTVIHTFRVHNQLLPYELGASFSFGLLAGTTIDFIILF